MNYSIIAYILGWVTFLEGAFMLLPLLTAVIYAEKSGLVFAGIMLVCLLVGYFLIRKKPTNTVFYAREGFVSVALSWILLSAIGALPFTISGEIPFYIDALFETISGFTTTGASVVPDVEALSKCMNLWRCFTNWIGGMGVLVFILAILPMAGGQTIHLMRAESPGPSIGKFVPKMKKTAVILYEIYTGLTLLEFVLLLFGGMSVFEAICASFSTAGTGGFGVLSTSMATYNSYIQVVITIFMVLFSINFSFYFFLIFGTLKEAFEIEEVRWYVIIVIISTLLISINVLPQMPNYGESLKHAAFQVSTIISTTGFATMDFDQWPQFSRTLLVILMFLGGCAGSTGGGIKISRIIIYIKSVKKELSYFIHPRSIKVLKMDNKILPDDEIRTVNIFLITYFIVFGGSLLVLAFDGYDLTTNFTAVAATINNIGPGLEMVGPSRNYEFFNPWSKIVLMFDMLAGRLELFPLLLLFSPGAWKKN